MLNLVAMEDIKKRDKRERKRVFSDVECVVHCESH